MAVINVWDAYERYKLDLELSRVETIDLLARAKSDRSFVLSLLFPYKEEITRMGFTRVNDIPKLTQFHGISRITNPIIRTYLTTLIERNQIIAENEKKLEYIKNNPITKEIYLSICDTANQALVNHMIRDAWKMHILGVGDIFVITAKTKNNTGIVSWHKSNEVKKRLLEEGKIPYKAIKNEKGEIIGDNGGVKWLVYASELDKKYRAYFRWAATACKLHNSSQYYFMPTIGETGVREKLNLYLRENPTAYLRYIRF